MGSHTRVKTLPFKPVHPTNIRTHGLFGLAFVRQHMMFDERWTPTSLTEQFKGMGDLLSKRLVFKKLESKSIRKRFQKENRALRRQCRDGRTKLQNCLRGESKDVIKNLLINHKDMQRLYQKMPIEMVLDNINQRTFVMRKERDRLRFRLDKLKEDYKQKLLSRATLENRIKYQNEFILDEDLISRDFRKKIENSNVRLKAIKTINATYKKMIQILRHDSIFYEPILRSLRNDIDDQTNFIKHILSVGMPAISKFKELNEEYRQMEERSRKNIQQKLAYVNNLRKESALMRHTMTQATRFQNPEGDRRRYQSQYVRETFSMMFLMNELSAIESTIKMVKFATLCSQAREIYPRIKSQVDSNKKLRKIINHDVLGLYSMEMKMKRADVLEGVLVNNLSEEEVRRMAHMKELQDAIEKENQFEAETLDHMKRRASAYILMRFTLWNLHEILRHVERESKITRISYPKSYLKLPLLKFEMLTMRACAPELFEENLDNVLKTVLRKMGKLMAYYKTDLSKDQTEFCSNEYQADFLETHEGDEINETEEMPPAAEEDEILDAKVMQQVPSRKAVKALSARIVEEFSKKDE